MELAFKSEGLLSLFIAIINLVLVIWLRMSKKDYKFLIYAMLGLVLTFVSITIPIQLDGNYITLFWAAEMVLLLWLYVKSCYLGIDGADTYFISDGCICRDTIFLFLRYSFPEQLFCDFPVCRFGCGRICFDDGTLPLSFL